MDQMIEVIVAVYDSQILLKRVSCFIQKRAVSTQHVLFRSSPVFTPSIVLLSSSSAGVVQVG